MSQKNWEKYLNNLSVKRQKNSQIKISGQKIWKTKFRRRNFGNKNSEAKNLEAKS